MMGLRRRWQWREGAGGASGPLIDRILAARGLSKEEAASFLSISRDDLRHPSTLAGGVESGARLAQAVKDGETIGLFGDYDADGITGTAILWHILKAASPTTPIETLIPNRLTDGYGLSIAAVDDLGDRGVTLLVTIDCGITSVDEVAHATARGIDVIVTDHHNLRPDGEIPAQAIVVHPRSPDAPAPFDGLCGAGVAFKVAWACAEALCGSTNLPAVLRQALIEAAPLAALGTVADMVPLIDENRYIARWGLAAMTQTSLPGLKALIEEAKIDQSKVVDSLDAGFRLAPRINACGRLEDPQQALRLLLTDSQDEATTLAATLSQLNDRRRRDQKVIEEAAVARVIDDGHDRDDQKIIVLADEAWNRGIVGIACTRLVERFHRPVILMQEIEGKLVGSARSIPGFSIYEALAACSDHLTTFGGHEAAAGLSLEVAALPDFQEAIARYASAKISPEDMVPTITIDATIDSQEITVDTFTALDRLRPHGKGNARPVLHVQSMTIKETKAMGAHGAHLSLKFQPLGSTKWIRGVWWREGESASEWKAGGMVDVVFRPSVNSWRGSTTAELDIQDIRWSDSP